MRFLARYQRLVRLGWWMSVVIGAGGFFVMQEMIGGGITLVLVGIVVGLGAPWFARWWLWRDAYRRFAAVRAREDVPALRALFDEMRQASPKTDLAYYEAIVLASEERWADAHEKLASIDRLPMKEAARAFVLHGLAGCLVELGRGEEAIALVEEARLVADDSLRTHCAATLGAALVVAGRSAEGVRRLEEALRSEGSKASDAARAFYLGEGLRALGRTDEARAAYQRAVDTKSSYSHARRAQQQLAALPTGPHR